MPEAKAKTKEQQQQEWMELVHNGSCCAFEDPHKEEKKVFISSLSKSENEKASKSDRK